MHNKISYILRVRSSVARMCRAAISSSLRRWATSGGQFSKRLSIPLTISWLWALTDSWYKNKTNIRHFVTYMGLSDSVVVRGLHHKPPGCGFKSTGVYGMLPQL